MAVVGQVEALQIAEATGDRVAQLGALTGLGSVHRMLGCSEQAAGHYGRALQLAKVISDRLGQLQAPTGLGHVHRTLDRHSEAALARKHGNSNWTATALSLPRLAAPTALVI